MSDYANLRGLSLIVVLNSLGFKDWKSRKDGQERYGACPIHGGKNGTAFSFHADGRFRCFSCNAHGRGAIDLVKAVKKCGFQEAISWLQSLSHSADHQQQPEFPVAQAEDQRQPQSEIVQNPAFKSSYAKFAVPSEWLAKRGLTVETLAHFGVFQYNNPKRRSAYTDKVLLPIKRFADGELVGYLARSIQGEPKYVWPKGVLKSLELFGAWNLRQSGQQLPLRVGYLVESPFAVMKFHQMGLPAVSCYGWSTSPQQCEILQQLARGWIVLPDRNKRDESLKQVAPLLAPRMWVRFPEYPGDDPEHLPLEVLSKL